MSESREGGPRVRLWDTLTDLYQDRRTSVWNHDADTTILRDDRDRYVDSASWGLRHRRAVDDLRAVDDRRAMDDRRAPGHRAADGRHAFGPRR
ncbi:hypothetical protein AB5J52_45905 [Streptomyces sp. R39]|uniref:Uncharacterized protein n=1 Tax=Streptomyces sp. R39 TaxID=3238631 RepID=A0AB39R2C2_9ACTN